MAFFFPVEHPFSSRGGRTRLDRAVMFYGVLFSFFSLVLSGTTGIVRQWSCSASALAGAQGGGRAFRWEREQTWAFKAILNEMNGQVFCALGAKARCEFGWWFSCSLSDWTFRCEISRQLLSGLLLVSSTSRFRPLYVVLCMVMDLSSRRLLLSVIHIAQDVC